MSHDTPEEHAETTQWAPSSAEWQLMGASPWDSPQPIVAAWITSLSRRTASALGDVLQSDCRVRMKQDSEECRSSVYQVRFVCDTEGASITLSLDTLLARAIADVAASQLGGAIGVGPLTQTEFGVIDYVVTSTLIALGTDGPTHGWRVESFGTESRTEPDQKPISAGADSEDLGHRLTGGQSFEVTVGVLHGEAFVNYVLPESPQHLPTTDENSESSVSESMTLELRYGPRPLDSDDVDLMEIGDVLMLGVTELTGPGRQLRVVSEKGWELARAIGLSQTPLRLTAQVGPWQFAAPDQPKGHRLVDVRLGRRDIRSRELQMIAADDHIDFENPDGMQVGLLEGATLLAEGELVRVDGELGVRVVSTPARGVELTKDQPETSAENSEASP